MPGKGNLVLLGMFDMSRLDRAIPVRIHNLHLALNALHPTTLLADDRLPRRMRLLRYLLSGGLGRTRAIYVEASTSTATETDLAFLALAHAARIPIVIFIPDAYQFFPDIFPRRGWKVRLLDWGWRRSIDVYQRTADMLLYPSLGLASYFHNLSPYDVLPPAGPAGLGCPPLPWDPPEVVYLGAASYRYGSDLLLDAMQQVVEAMPEARLRFVTVDPSFLESHPARHAPWLTVEQRAFNELPAIMRRTTLAVAPLRRNAYNDLAMPVKMFDYLAFGRPMVVTDCRDMAAFVREVDAGIVVEENTGSLAAGILSLLRNRDLAERLSQNGYDAVQTAHSWPHRAARLLGMIEAIEQGRRPA